MLPYSKFCKDGLILVKLPEHVVIEVQSKIIYCCADWNQKIFCCLLIINISLMFSNLLPLTAIVLSALFHLIFRTRMYRGADKSLARPTSQCILFDGENISFDASLVVYI